MIIEGIYLIVGAYLIGSGLDESELPNVELTTGVIIVILTIIQMYKGFVA